MDKLIRKLPDDLILKIMKLVYESKYQSKVLLDDIKNYHTTLDRLINGYRYRWVNLFQEPYQTDLKFLISDIYSFHIYMGFEILARNYNHIKPNVLHSKKVMSEIRIFWGLFTINERNFFLIKRFV